MRKWIVLLPIVLLAASAGAGALEPVSVNQLEQLLTQSRGLSDADLAAKLSGLQLTERISAAHLTQWRGTLAGPRAERALLALTDRSKFMAPPALEIPGAPAPSFAEQRRMMGLAAAYVTQAIPQLPHLYATRAVTHFEGDPSDGDTGPVHAMRITRNIVQYQDGEEVVAPLTNASAVARKIDQGLDTWGVFGPVLSLVLLDAAQNKLGWERWEQGAMESPMAVFHFTVPRERSHYQVRYCCTLSDYGMAEHLFEQMTGYHGEMAIDPATGAIARVVIQADLQSSDPISRADIEVEYGSVLLGGVEYNCPVRSVSISIAQTLRYTPDGDGAVRRSMGPPRMLLNHADFDSYHLFRAESRVLTASEERNAGTAPDATLPSPVQTADAGANQPAEENLTDAPAAKPGEAAAAIAADDVPEITAAAATGLPDKPLQASADAPQPEPTDFRLRINARLVDVNVVALDKKGHPITGLKPEDFAVYDDGVKQDVRSFSDADAPAPAATAPAAEPPTTAEPAFSNQHPTVAAQPQNGNTLVFLIDPSNLVYNDLVDARQQMLKFLSEAPASDPVALYIMRFHAFQVMQEATTDHEKVRTILAKWTPNAQDLLNARDEEDRNHQHFETVHNLEDMLSVNGNFILDTQTQGEALDPKLRELGSIPAPAALDVLVSVANHLAPMAGHKSLVWITSDNALADWNHMSDTIEKHSRYVEPYALRTQEAMNNAQVSVYPLDASRLEANVITADLGNRNVQLSPTYQLDGTLAILAYEQLGPEGKGADDADILHPQAMERNFTSNNRLRAQMQQDLHPIQGVFREIAEATGGHAFRRSSNIEGELKGVVEDGHATYVLGFSPRGQADSKYHVLTVKLLNHRDATVRYRTGYQYDREPSTLKERFAKALWQPTDVSEIAISARPVTDSAGKAIRVTIAGTDLDLTRQGPASAPQSQTGETPQAAATVAPHSVWSGKLDIFLVQRAEDGMRAHVTGQTVGLRLKPDTYQHAVADGLTFDERIQAKPEVESLRVVVVDVNSGRIGSVTVPTTALSVQPAAQTN
ncbi:MAG TPA: VWA domain-containing protein [Terracidiphilus sp.]|jgi:VWFA-related protein|nr:VWA domain-containing protein [Terracidiphilus sp.]